MHWGWQMRKSYRKFNQKSLKTQLTKFYETFFHALIICNTNMSFLDWLASNLLSDFFYNWLPFLPIHHILKSSYLLVPFFSDSPYVRDPLRSFYFSYFFFYTHTIYTSQIKNLPSPGNYISGRTWDTSQRAITK